MDTVPDALLQDILSRLPGRDLVQAACAARFLLAQAAPAAHLRIRALGPTATATAHWPTALRYAEACHALGHATVAGWSTHTLYVVDGALHASGSDPEGGDDLSLLGIDGAPPALSRVVWQPIPSVLPSAGARVLEVAAGATHSLALVASGEVFSFGRNRFGELGREGGGLPAVVDALLARRVRVRRVAAGVYFSLAVSEEGALHSWGSNAYGELGQAVAPSGRATPAEVGAPGDARVQAAAGGRTHSLVLTCGGGVCAAGRNAHGQLGLGSEVEAVAAFAAVEALRGVRVTQVACGNNHSLAVSLDGAVYAWGCAEGGQLGPGAYSRLDVPLPRQLPLDVAVRSVSAGHAHSLLAAADGRVFVAGDGGLESGGALQQLAPHFSALLPQQYAATWPPWAAGAPPRVCAGALHSFVFAEPAAPPPRGAPPLALSGFGLARHGQLGIPLQDVPLGQGQPVATPHPVPLPRPRARFRPPIQAGSNLEKQYYGALGKSMAHLPPEERLRILASLGPSHAWRLPPSHPGYSAASAAT